MVDDDPTLVHDLVAANRILYNRGVVDGFGHVSVRSHEHADHFLIARNMAPSLVTADDILRMDLNCVVQNDNRRSYLERFIHAEIYRARPDVVAVVHSHSPSIVPFTVVKDVKLTPVCHMCGFLRGQAPVFEIREVAGDGTDLLISNASLGAALAKTLGQNAVVLMRGHGSTVVGNSLKQAVFRAVYTELNATLQAAALRLGTPTYLTEAEADAAATTNEGQLDRPWQLWLRDAGMAPA